MRVFDVLARNNERNAVLLHRCRGVHPKWIRPMFSYTKVPMVSGAATDAMGRGPSLLAAWNVRSTGLGRETSSGPTIYAGGFVFEICIFPRRGRQSEEGKRMLVGAELARGLESSIDRFRPRASSGPTIIRALKV